MNQSFYFSKKIKRISTQVGLLNIALKALLELGALTTLPEKNFVKDLSFEKVSYTI